MRIAIFTVGSRGDVQPYVALGLGLQRAGHEVRLVTSAEFEALVRGRGLDFAPLSANPREVLEGEQGRALLESARNPVAFVRDIRRVIAPLVERMLDEAVEGCRGAELVVTSMFSFVGLHAADALGLPRVLAVLQPGSRTGAFPSFLFPPELRLPRPLNRLTHHLAEQAIWVPFSDSANRWRRRAPGLEALPWHGPYARLLRERTPYLYGFSRHVLPPPRDWPRFHHVTGYWFLDRPDGWAPPAELDAFLRAGPPPVYVGFGSMTARDAKGLAETAVRALERTGQRGVILSGWARLAEVELPPGVVAVDDVPHDWLFPRMAAIVHHGGAGTTGAALRGGVPSVVVPFFADQPFWGHRVHRLGVAPPPIPRAKLTADALARAIETMLADGALRARAAALGDAIRAEDGVAEAVRLIERSAPARRAAG